MTKAIFTRAVPYADDEMNLPVVNVDAAVPYYEQTFGFRVLSRQETPHKAVVLARDGIQIGLAENGGDPTQEGCFFEVDDIEAAYHEVKGKASDGKAIGVETVNGVACRTFFDVAPDGLCYMFGQPEDSTTGGTR